MHPRPSREGRSRWPPALLAVLALLSPALQPCGGSGGGEQEEGGCGPREAGVRYSEWAPSSRLVPWNGSALHPSTAPGPDGSMHVVWADGREGAGHIYYTKLDRMGGILLSEMKLTGEVIDLDLSRPKAVSDPFGNFHLVWLSDFRNDTFMPSHGARICHRYFSSSGEPLIDTRSNWFALGTPEYPDPVPGQWVHGEVSAALLTDWSLAVAFTVNWSGLVKGAPPWQCPAVGWMLLSANGSKLGEAALQMGPSGADPLRHAFGISLASDGQNRTHVTWLSWAGSGWTVRWALVDKDATVLDARDINPGYPLDAPPSLAISPAGTVTAVLIDNRTWDLVALSYPADTGPASLRARVVRRVNWSAPAEFQPRYLVRSACDRDGNLLLLAEGDPLGDGWLPGSVPSCVGFFAADPEGNLTFEHARLIMASYDAGPSPPPDLAAPFLLPSLSVGSRGDVLVAYQFPAVEPARPSGSPGIYIRRTGVRDPGLRDLRLHYPGPYPYDNETVDVWVEACNEGDFLSANLTVNISVDGKLLRSMPLSLEKGAVLSVNASWSGPAGNHSFTAELEPGPGGDGDHSNNRLSHWMWVFEPPDLCLTSEDITLFPAQPREGDWLDIGVVVRNGGDLMADGDLLVSVDGILLGTRRLAVPPDGSASANFTWEAERGGHRVSASAVNVTPREREQDNNAAWAYFNVAQGPQVEPPLLTIQSPVPGEFLKGTVEVNGTAYTSETEAELKVDVRIDDGAWVPAEGNFSWSYRWNTALVPDGLHAVWARASVRRVSVSASVQVDVGNSLPGKIWFVSLYPPGNSSIFEGDRIAFRAEAASVPARPEGLLYEWRLDGTTVGLGRELQNHTYRSDHRSAGAHGLALTVSMLVGPVNLSVLHVWNFSVLDVNLPPVIEGAAPPEAAVRMVQGFLADFSVNASDPDGDALGFAWSLDGRPLSGSGPSLRFKAPSPGRHELAVNVSDGRLSALRSWTVEVKPAPKASSAGAIIPYLAVTALALLLAVAVLAFLLLRGPRKGRGGARGPRG